jgi:hypothetical protein
MNQEQENDRNAYIAARRSRSIYGAKSVIHTLKYTFDDPSSAMKDLHSFMMETASAVVSNLEMRFPSSKFLRDVTIFDPRSWLDAASQYPDKQTACMLYGSEEIKSLVSRFGQAKGSRRPYYELDYDTVYHEWRTLLAAHWDSGAELVRKGIVSAEVRTSAAISSAAKKGRILTPADVILLPESTAMTSFWAPFLDPSNPKSNLYPHLAILVEACLVVPFSNAVVEGGFSNLAFIKDLTRSRLTQEHVNQALFVYLNGPCMDVYKKRDLDAVFSRYVGDKSRRELLALGKEPGNP